MKILYLANLRLPTEKAYGIQIAKMCEAFAALKFKIKNEKVKTSEDDLEEKLYLKLVAPYRKNKIKDDFFDYYSVKRNFEFKRIWAPDFYLPGKLDRLSFYIKNIISAAALSIFAFKSRADVIYSRDEMAVFILSFFKNNVVFEAHKFPKYRRWFWRILDLNGVIVVTITRALRDDIIKTGFRGKIQVAPDGADPAQFNISISKEEARKRLGWPPDKKIVMYVGHLYDWKGAPLLLEVARKFQVSSFKFQVLFVFVGGTEYDLEKFRKKAEGSNNVLILGQKPHKDIPVYLKSADILILPNSAEEEISKSYTSPLKMFEYMASKRPIVATNLPSIREVLNDANAVLMEANSTDKLVLGTLKLLNDPAICDRLAAKAFEDVQQYTWQNRAKKIIDFVK